MTMEGLNYYTKDEVDDIISGGGSGSSVFMKRSVYDANNNGIVDNAEACNGHTVATNVPANAVFTDTTYTAGSGIQISNGVISCTYAKLPQGTNFKDSTSDLYYFLCTLDLSELAGRTSFNGMFSNCKALTNVPLFDTSNGTDFTQMFIGCDHLVSVPQFNLASATKTYGMFYYCDALTSAPLQNTGNVTDMENMFQRCKALVTAPSLDMSSVTKCPYMFKDCTALTSVPQYNMSNCTDPGAMFNGCSALVTVPQFNWSSVTSFGGALSSTHMFDGCTSLSNASLNNILASLTSATSYSPGLLTPKTLKFIGLTQAQATICEGLSNFAAFTAAGWSTGY